MKLFLCGQGVLQCIFEAAGLGQCQSLLPGILLDVLKSSKAAQVFVEIQAWILGLVSFTNQVVYILIKCSIVCDIVYINMPILWMNDRFASIMLFTNILGFPCWL